MTQKAASPQSIPVSYKRTFKAPVVQETDPFSLTSCQKKKSRKNEMTMTFSKEKKRHQYWIAVRRAWILTNELRDMNKLVVLGVFLEPVQDFLGFTFSIASLTVYSFH